MSSTSALDEFIERIVREVIRRLEVKELRPLSAAKPLESGQAILCLSEKLITAAAIESVPAGTTEITIATRAILTPLARDQARDRGIRIVRQTPGSKT